MPVTVFLASEYWFDELEIFRCMKVFFSDGELARFAIVTWIVNRST